MGGKETIVELLAIDPEVRAIVSSSYSNDPVMADFRKYGFSGIIVKPYSMNKILIIFMFLIIFASFFTYLH